MHFVHNLKFTWTKCGQIAIFECFLRGQNPRKPNTHRYLPQHCLYFFPEPHGHGSFLPTFLLLA